MATNLIKLTDYNVLTFTIGELNEKVEVLNIRIIDAAKKKTYTGFVKVVAGKGGNPPKMVLHSNAHRILSR